MHSFTRSLCALLLVVVCLPLAAANSGCPAIRTLTATDAQTGEPVVITWSLSGSGAPQSLTLTGHDFPAPVALAPGQTSYTYTPSMPGEKQVTVAAVSPCGTFTQTAKYHVKECNVVPPAMTVSATSVAPGATIQASLDLQPGHTARWEVTNGTASATTGGAITVTAGGAGTVGITAFVSRGSSCSVAVTQSVQVVSACPIEEPVMLHPPQATAGAWFDLYLPAFDDPSGPLKVELRVTGAEPLYLNYNYLALIAPAQGSFSIDVIVSNGTCSRTFTKTFTVQACTSAAAVSAGQTGSCGATTAVANFTGVAPFQGSWSDGQYFFTWDSHIERPIGGGTFTLNWFMDANCEGPISGSATGGADLPAPSYTIEPIVNGGWYGSDTCPGLVRIARLDAPVPAGATVEWSIANGTIVSGQGTAEVQFTGAAPGSTNLTVVYRDANGCPSASYAYPYLLTMGKPEFTVTVEPSVIPAGGTAVITVQSSNPEFTRGMGVTSSLGDTIEMLGSNGQWEYRSSHGGGEATITVEIGNACERTVKTATLTIDGSHPVTATAKVRAIGSNCSDYLAYAELTGTPPFTGIWSSGESFTSYEPYQYLQPQSGGTYTLTSFSDANGPGTVTGSATFNFTPLPKPAFTVDVAKVCPGSVATATLSTPIPAGATPSWLVYGGEILSGQGTASIQFSVSGPYNAILSVTLSGEGMCSTPSDWQYVDTYRPPQAPQFSVRDIHQGEQMFMVITLDGGTTDWGMENSLGDPMEVVGQPYPTTYYVQYTSTHGTGPSTVRVWSKNTCGAMSELSRTFQILAPLAPAPTATLTAVENPSCGNDVTVIFTGTPPFTANWQDGVSFTTSDFTYTRHFTNTETYIYLWGISDANRPADNSSNTLFLDFKPLPYVPVYGPSWICVGQTGTVTAELPEGWTVQWDLPSTTARIVDGQGTPNVVIEALESGYHQVNATFKNPEGCTGWGGTFIWSPEANVPNPVLTLPATTVKAGESIEFTAAFQGSYQSLNWESSNGDPIWNVGQNDMTFTLHYLSQNGPGTTTIKVSGTTICGQYVEATAALTITE